MHKLFDLKQDLIKIKHPATGLFEPKHQLTFIFEDEQWGIDIEGDPCAFPQLFTVKLRLAPEGLQQLITELQRIQRDADWSEPPPLSVD